RSRPCACLSNHRPEGRCHLLDVPFPFEMVQHLDWEVPDFLAAEDRAVVLARQDLDVAAIGFLGWCEVIKIRLQEFHGAFKIEAVGIADHEMDALAEERGEASGVLP